MEAHRGFATFRGSSRADLIIWIQGILNHRVQTAYRRYRGTSCRNLAREVPLNNRGPLRTRRGSTGSSVTSPSGEAMADEERARLESAIRQLSPRHEQVIRLRNELKFTFVEVGLALGCSADAAQKLWSRAIHRLARRLKPTEPG